jgi:uncharacterized protein (DUF1501 family)
LDKKYKKHGRTLLGYRKRTVRIEGKKPFEAYAPVYQPLTDAQLKQRMRDSGMSNPHLLAEALEINDRARDESQQSPRQSHKKTPTKSPKKGAKKSAKNSPMKSPTKKTKTPKKSPTKKSKKTKNRSQDTIWSA